MTKANKDAATKRREYSKRVLRKEFALAVMSHDYETADRCWIQLDNLELGKKTRLRKDKTNEAEHSKAVTKHTR